MEDLIFLVLIVSVINFFYIRANNKLLAEYSMLLARGTDQTHKYIGEVQRTVNNISYDQSNR